MPEQMRLSNKTWVVQRSSRAASQPWRLSRCSILAAAFGSSRHSIAFRLFSNRDKPDVLGQTRAILIAKMDSIAAARPVSSTPLFYYSILLDVCGNKKGCATLQNSI
jgi:hypothetical protein